MQTKYRVRFRLAPALWLVALAAPTYAGEIRGRILIGGLPAAGVTVDALPYEALADEAHRLAGHGEAPKAVATATTRPDGTFAMTTAGTALGFRLQAQIGRASCRERV